MKRVLLLVVFFVALVSTSLPRADEGMWTFDNPPRKIWKERYNFDPPDAWLDHIRLATVRLTGATGSFVSPDGLILTNQHVAGGELQRVSTPERNYIRDGFHAATLDQELKCPDMTADVLVSYEDVTKRVQAAVKPGATSQDANSQRRAEIAAIEKDGSAKTGLVCQVVNLYSGGEYWLYRFKRYTDVRVVFAVEESIGFFGGDYDNFTYPRYDLDISFLRAYENGKPAKTDYFKWSAKGADEKELIFVPGNPGSTSRLLTIAQLQYQRDVGNPLQMQVWTSRRDSLVKYAATGAEAARRAAEPRRSMENSIKRLVGQQAGLTGGSMMKRKEAEEKDLRGKVAANPELRQKYASAWDDIAAAYAELPAYAKRIAFSTLAPSSLGNFALTLVRYAAEIQKPNSTRLDAFRDSRLDATKRTLLSPAPVFADMEESVLAWQLEQARKTLGPSDPFIKAALGSSAPAVVAKAVVGGTKLADVAVRKALLDGGPDAIAKSDDPMIVLARKVEPIIRELNAWQEQKITSVETSAGQRIAEARFAVYGKNAYPDANSNLRIEFGTVLGYEQGSTLVPYKTTFHGLFDRAASFNEAAPFSLPKRWKDRKGALDLTVPLNFVYTADTIGGNSGSPVINRNAEVVGVNFDSNLQKLPNRYAYIADAEGSRAVGVHSAGILEALAKMYEATALVDEIRGVRPQFRSAPQGSRQRAPRRAVRSAPTVTATKTERR
jgi:hypothetical protein